MNESVDIPSGLSRAQSFRTVEGNRSVAGETSTSSGQRRKLYKTSNIYFISTLLACGIGFWYFHIRASQRIKASLGWSSVSELEFFKCDESSAEARVLVFKIPNAHRYFPLPLQSRVIAGFRHV